MTDPLAELWNGLDDSSRSWLSDAVLQSAAVCSVPQSSPPVWESWYAQVGRNCRGREGEARVLFLHAVRPGADDLARLYARGTTAERRGVLRALPYLCHLTPEDLLPLVEDALRTNDTGLIAAAVGPYAAEHLGAHAWRHAVLKCVFTGVPVSAVADLRRRASGDLELARMLDDYAAERRAAGRPVPLDVQRVLRLTTQES